MQARKSFPLDVRQALGGDAVASLTHRNLLVPNTGTGAVAAASLERTHGVIAGLATGNALARVARRRQARDPQPRDVLARELRDCSLSGSSGRTSAPTQSFVLSAEAWLDHEWRAPVRLAEQLDQRLEHLRSPGHATRRTVAARRRGAPWYEAASASDDDAALARAAAVGLVGSATPSHVGTAASLDTVVTHASETAVAASAAMAAIVAGLVSREPGTAPRDVVARVVACIEDLRLRAVLESVLGSGSLDPGEAATRFGTEPQAPTTLGLALWCALCSADPVTAVAIAAAMRGDAEAVAAATGALVGAIHGASALPGRWIDEVEGAAALRVLAQRVVDHQQRLWRDGDDRTAGESRADIWFLLDRSGSMSSIAEYVVTGFDGFLAEQRAIAGVATVTVVQFDDQDPHDVIVDARPLRSVRSIGGRFEPRGMTPLYDATGLLLDRAEAHRGDPADQLVVILTDGVENASRHWDRRRLFDRIATLRDRGWTFVFLGANQDSYEAGAHLSMRAGNVSNFQPSPVGVAAMNAGLNRTVAEWRGKSRAARRRDRDEFWGDRKEAEEVAPPNA